MSEIFQQMYVNFVKTGNPNGLGLPQWDAYNSKGDVPPVMMIKVKSAQERNAKVESRYHKIDALIQAKIKANAYKGSTSK